MVINGREDQGKKQGIVTMDTKSGQRVQDKLPNMATLTQ